MKKKLFATLILLMISYISIAGTITITSPNGGEVWAGCTVHNITWTASGVSNNYTLDYSTDGGASWISVTSSLFVTNGTYAWTVPNISSTNCKIRIIDSNTPTTIDLSDNSFSITAPLMLLTPNGGETWQAGSSKAINWVASGTSNFYDIFYSTNAGSSWTSIVSNQYNTSQTYTWSVPNLPSAQCLVKIQDHTNTSCMVDISNNLFTISPPTPVIYVSSPNGGNILYAGNQTTISWSSAYVTSTYVKIDYSVDNGNNWTPIVTSTSNSGTYSWTVPINYSTNCLVKVTDLSNPSTYDQSDAVFTIAPPFINVTSPNGNESWVGCSSQYVSWTSGGTSGTYYIYYSTNNGTTWNYINNTTSNSFNWNPIPNVASSNCLIKVSDYNNANIKDSSDNQFNLIANSDIIVTAPNGGEQWEAGTYKTINWVSAPTSSTYSVYYTINGGSTWNSILSSTSAKTLSWSVPNNPSSNCKIKVVDYSNTCKYDVSDANFTITPPTPVIIVSNPYSNATFYQGNTMNISWSSAYLISSFVRIEVSINAGASWTDIANPTENDGSYNWSIPATINSQQCVVRISEYNNAPVYGVSSGLFKIIPPYIILTSPNGGETWAGCSSQTISWTSGGTSGTYNIYYSTNNGTTWNYINNTTSTSFNWNPVISAASTSCLIKVQDYSYPNVKDSSDVTFTLTANTDIIVTSPNGGEQWEAGTFKTISWIAAPTSTYYSVYYSINNGSTWNTVISSTSAKTQNFMLPNTPSTNCKIKVVDYSNTCKFDVSDANFSITPPTPVITVTNPNNGGTYYQGNSFNITWSTSYVNTTYVRIQFSSDNGTTWSDLASITENDGTYAWTVPIINSQNCKIRVSDYTNPLTYDDNDAVFKIVPPYITVTTPNGGENWKACSTKNIYWNSAGTSNSYNVYYSLNNGATWNYIGYTSSSSLSWNPIPNVTSTTTSCLIKVSDYNNANIKDSSDVNFTITKNTDIIITSPIGGENWVAGATKNITWVSEATTTSFSIYYSINGGSSWNTITTLTSGNSKSWIIPNTPSTNSLIRIDDYSNTCISDVSDASFTIAAPTPYISVSYPNTNVTTYAGNNISITWSSAYLTSSFVKIQFTSDNGATWTDVVGATTNNGSYSWTLPNINSLNCKFRVSEFNNLTNYDESDVAFKIVPPYITVTTPNGGENWKACSSKTINWTSGGTSGSYNIYYSTNNGATWNYISNTSSSNISWNPVPNVPATTPCIIKVVDYNNPITKDSSDLPFTLTKNTDIIIGSPNGYESWIVGATNNITWVSEPTTSVYTVFYSSNAGSTWNTVTTTSYGSPKSWTIPNTPSTTSLVKVVDYNNTCIYDVSDTFFTISPPLPYISVIYPNSNATTYANNNITIQWTSGYLTSSFVRIQFTSDNGATWSDVVAITPNNGSYSWILPNINSNSCKFRVSEYNNPSTYDDSDVPFKVIPPFITVLTPNGGELWKGCGSQTISWTSGGTSGTYYIYYSLDNGLSWQGIYYTSATSVSWNPVVNSNAITNCLIKVQDYNNSSIKDSSNATFTITPNDDIIVSAPNGNEQWQAGSSQTINWVSSSASSHFYVYYSINNGSSWNTLNSNTYSKYYNWTVPNTPSTNCLIKVVDYDNSCISDISNTKFTITPGTPKVTAPNGGEATYYGSTYTIYWTNAYFNSNYVTINYSIDSGFTWLPVAPVANNNGSYTWNVPGTPSNKCLVKVNEYNNPAVYDISDAVFSISPGLIVTSPNGDNGMEEWRVCTVTTLKWTSGGGSGYYKIEYSTNNGQTWTTINSSYNSSGSNNTYDWTIPNTPSTQCLVRISDNSYALKTDVSDAVFSIKSAIIINTPNGGESLQPGTNYNIAWTALGSSSFYNIDYSTNGGSTWNSIVYNTNIPSSNYNWSVPAASSTNCLVRVTDYINTCKLDKSDNSFAIGLPAPTLSLTTPSASGITLTGCSTYNITWTATGTSNTYSIEYTLDSGYTWNSIINNYSTLSGTYAWTVPNVSAAKCKVRVKDAANYSTNAVSSSTFIIAPSNIVTITANGATTFCTGGNVQLTSSSATNNVWYPGGQTTQTITVAASGVYYVTVNNASCPATSNQIAVSVNTIPSAPVATSNTPVPLNGTLQLLAGTIPNAVYNWTGPNGFTSILQNPTIANATSALNGIYSVTAAVNSCLSTAGTVNVTVSGTPANVAITGTIRTEQGYYLNNTKLKLTGITNDSATTTTNGQYSFSLLQGNPYTVTPSKGNDIAANAGLSTLDLILIQRHILNIQPLSSPYKIIAADVNQSGSVTTMDILYIKSLILQTASSFPANEVWKFVNSDFTFTNPQQPFPYESTRSYSYASAANAQDFVAIKLGDVNNSWSPSYTKAANVGNLYLSMMSQNAVVGDIISIPVKVNSFNNISGYQFTMEWNPLMFEFVSADNAMLMNSFGENFTTTGKLSVLWSTEAASGITLADGSIIFNLKLKVINAAASNETITINSAITNTEAYNSDLNELTIVSSPTVISLNNPLAVANNSTNGYYLNQNIPNPFSDNTSITFSIPSEQKVEIGIYNVMGELIKKYEGKYSKGEHTLIWDGKNAYEKTVSGGNYIVRMNAGAYTANKKMVIIR